MSKDDVLSALMDGEAQELELRRLLRDMPQQPETLQRWHRYHLVREVFTGSQPRSVDLSQRVREVLAQEPGQGTATGLRHPAWRRALGSVAVAASVAMVVLVGGQQLAQDGGAAGSSVGPLPGTVVQTQGAIPVQASFGQRSSTQLLQPADRTAYRELARQRLRRYSFEHAEHAALNTPAGMVPYARVPNLAAETQAGSSTDTQQRRQLQEQLQRQAQEHEQKQEQEPLQAQQRQR